MGGIAALASARDAGRGDSVMACPGKLNRCDPSGGTPLVWCLGYYFVIEGPGSDQAVSAELPVPSRMKADLHVAGPQRAER